MNILFFADPNSIHDTKWINYFADRKIALAYLLPREHHAETFSLNPIELNANLLPSIKNFSILRFYRTILTVFRIKKILIEKEIDIINIHYAEPNALWCIFKWYFKKPIIITTLGTDVLKTIPEAFEKKTLINYIVAPAYKLAFSKADWVTGTSQNQLDSIKAFSKRNENLSIIRTGVDIERLLENTSNFFPLKTNNPYILFPRYIKRIYNHEFCLKAISLLPERIKENFKMIFVGRNYGDKIYQNELVKQMGSLTDVKFEFLENQSQESIFELYKRSSLVVMTPISDGSPVSAMEALICGAKVILGPLAYDKDIFSENVIFLKSWNPSELAEKITSNLEFNNKKNNLSEALINLMDRSINMEKMKEIYLSLLNKTIFF